MMNTGGPDGGGSIEADDTIQQVTLSLDAILSLLSDRHRRDLLRYLIESEDDTCTHDKCIGYITRQEERRRGERPGHDEIAAALHHIHIPKLSDAGVVEYDGRSQEIRYWGNDRLEKWLQQIQAAEDEERQ